MTSRTFSRFLLGVLLCGSLVTAILPTAVVHAQAVDAGLNTVGAVTGLSATDPRIIAVRIINASLGLLAIILTCVILYAGFLWMTAGGDAEQVERAKRMIRNGIIGVIIILSSWGIVSFIINKLLDATGRGDGGVSGGGGTAGGILEGSGGALGFQVRGISPVGSVPLRNVEVRFTFTRELRESTVSGAIKVLRASDQSPVDGTLQTEGAIVTFTPSAPCPAPYSSRRCFGGDTEYIARVERSLRSNIGQSLACGGLAPVCEVRFRTGNVVDVTAPTVVIQSPFAGQAVPANDIVRITTHATDDSGISLIETVADGRSIGTAVPSPSSTSVSFDGTVAWDTRGVSTGTHRIFSRALDIDSNRSTSTPIDVMVRPRHCFNLVQDEDETGLNCGGSCGACSGEACRVGGDCAGGICTAGRCVEQPVITGVSPLDGRPGTYVTLSGVNFGTTTGQVLFGGRTAHAPDACAAAGASLWTQTQVVVEVPVGAATGTVQLVHRNGLSDTTTDDRGPRLGEFRVNTRTYPGLCAIRPGSARVGDTSRLDLDGVNLGTSSDHVSFNDRSVDRFLSWSDRNIGLATPLLSPGGYSVQAHANGVPSNPVFFSLEDRVFSSPPVIDGIEPATGTVGSYITLVGRNFGDRGQVIFRQGTARGVADTRFPAACGNNYWRNGSITVKVPENLQDGLGAAIPVRPGMYQVSVMRDGLTESARVGFQVVAGAPAPGICAIQPIAGPSGTPITVFGEHFGSLPSRLVFTASTGSVDAVTTAWTDQSIASTVPSTAVSGLVHVVAGVQRSNGVVFTARNCNETAGICENGQACCPDGSCSVGGVCRAAAGSAQFAWRTSTGRIIRNPAVVEACNATDPPSPSPWGTRSGGNDVCVNAQVVVLFTTRIEDSTINTASGNVIVRRCTGTTGDPCSSGTPVAVTGTLEHREHDNGDYLIFTPSGGTGLWDTSSTYEVILKKNIRATAADGGLTMVENRDRYGAGNAYSFRFRTRAFNQLCQATSVSVSPFNWTMEHLGLTKLYGLSARGDDQCVQLNASTMGWLWSVSDRGRASVAAVTGRGSDVQNVTGLGPTEAPIQVKANLVRPAPPAGHPVIGSGNLTIRIEPPRVEAHGPDCDQACINAAIWARFNVSLDPASLSHTEAGTVMPNVVVKRCVNENCREFDRTLALTPGMLRLEDASVGDTSVTNTLLIVDPGETLLEREKFYKVWVLGGDQGIRSVYGHLPLTGLNDSDPVAFSWKFRVRGGTNPRCAVDRVEVVPGERYESAIGARQLFRARPISAPDICSRDGEILITDRSFSWGTSDARVADFVTLGAGRDRVALATSLPPFCTDRCLNRGSQGVYGHIAICGDSRVQTTDTHYCRRPPAAGGAVRFCAVGDTDCTTPVGTPCTVLPPGSTGSEECDETGDNCTNRCLWAGRSSVREGGTCGNGTIDRGEACDVGSVCVGGTNPGRDCTRDTSVCGTGGACSVTARRGCSERCLALGSGAGSSTCGNNDVADGETCDDGNTSSGDGCSSSCLVEGSSSGVTSLCGDGRIDAGESCEMSTAGDPDHSTYCSLPEGETRLRCVTGTRFRDLCDAATCLNLGTSFGRGPGQCGNGTIDAGEECDGGEGCSSRCLKLGSSLSYRSPSLCGDRTVGVGEQCDAPSTAPVRISNAQLFEITGLREPTDTERRTNQNRMKADLTATYDEHDGHAVYGVQCNFTSELSCAEGTGLTRAGCCAPRPTVDASYPTGTDVCRNTVIYARFNQPMDPATTERNFVVAKSVSGSTCPAGTTPLENHPAVTWSLRSWIASLWHRVLAFFSIDQAIAGPPPAVWCVGSVQGHIEFVDEDDRTTANFLLNEALEPNTDYQVILRGETDLSRAPSSTRGIRSFRGVVARGDTTWNFRTGSDVCTVSAVDIQDSQRAHPYLFYKANEAHRYAARSVSLRRGVQVPITPITGLYSWNWQRWTTQRPTIVNVAESRQIPIQTFATTTAQNKNGSSFVSASLVITADRVSTTTSVGRVFSASRLSTVILCENPWIPDMLGNEAHLPKFKDTDFNFMTTYCRDAGGPGTADDLPSIRVHQVPSSPADVSRGVLRQYLFSFAEPSLRADGIGIRVIANRLHYSVRDWYLSQGFNGRPQITTIDGYQALRDGETIYIGAANTDEGLTRADTNIYVISRNPNAGREASAIFDQMAANLVFNSNLTTQVQNVCATPAGSQYVDPASGGTVYCTADWECLRREASLHCLSMKEKLERDLQRISDFQFISRKLEETKARTGSYPNISTGSQLQGFATSRWDAWQNSLGATLGQRDLPRDPINAFLTCGRCQGTGNICSQDADCPQNARCVPLEGRDPSTCWSTASSTYACPVLAPTNPDSVSHVYQYRSIGGGDRFELSTELEALGPEQYRPALLVEARRCTSGVDGLCQTDADCAPLVSGRPGPTVPGSCAPAGGRWIYSDMCRGVAFGSGQLCGDGVVNTHGTTGHPAEVCELGQTQLAQCDARGQTGTKVQVCRTDCQGFVDVPGGSCSADTLCGNNRVDTKRCTGGARAGTHYGASCTTNSDCDAGVTCETVSTPEVCDDGALNGTYGHCNRTCSGYGGTCGDNLVSPGERCDLGEQNGAYCNTAGTCTVSATCGSDCRSYAPYCGDHVVNGSEECDDSAAEVTTQGVCRNPLAAGRLCSTNSDCDVRGTGAFVAVSETGICGGTPETTSCAGVGAGLCAGGSHDGEGCACSTNTPGTTCASESCGGGSCVVYRTQRTRTCINAGITPSADQCRWNEWSACQPVGQCGDGVVDSGEECDDGNRYDNDTCTNSCKRNTCGDGVLNAGVEECDYGGRNGSACTGADYGSTCVACTAQCRMTASSGGYCGNNRRDGTEQCDGRDLGARASTLSCQSLGYDYAEAKQCTASKYLTRDDGSILSIGPNTCCAAYGSSQVAGQVGASGCRPMVRPSDASAGCHEVTLTTPRTFTGADAEACMSDVARDAISCSRTCSYAGCRRCSDEHGTAVISGQVLDAQYSSLGVPSARVTLYQRGVRLSEQFTDASGRFSFTSMSDREECGQYRIVIDSTQDNPLTPTINEARNGGYWPFESRIFTTATFLSDGIRNSAGKIYLIPRVPRNETLVVHTWDGDLGGRYLLSHLVLPANRGYRWSTAPGDDGFVSGGACGTLAADTRPWYEWPCLRDIHEQDNSGGFQGHRDISHVPFARLFCAASLSTGTDGGSCYRINVGPQATRYRLQGTLGGTAAGTFVYYLHDQVGRPGQSSPDFYRSTKSTVYVVTADRFYTINPPEGRTSRCDGHYWQVFHQDAVTGEVVIPTDPAQAYQCGGDVIYGDTTPGNRLPTDRYTTVGDPLYGASWLNFGGGVSTYNWDMPR